VHLLSYQTAAGPAAAIQVQDTLVPTGALGASSTVRGLLETLDRDGLSELAARAGWISLDRAPVEGWQSG
jgi:hypothetical protein